MCNSDGNSMAMTKLVFKLRDRDDKWFVYLVAAAIKCECHLVVDDINPRLKEAGCKCYLNAIINFMFCFFSVFL